MRPVPHFVVEATNLGLKELLSGSIEGYETGGRRQHRVDPVRIHRDRNSL